MSGEHGRLVEVETEEEDVFLRAAAEQIGQDIQYFIGKKNLFCMWENEELFLKKNYFLGAHNGAWYSGRALPTSFTAGPYCGTPDTSGPLVLDFQATRMCLRFPR